MKKQTKRILMIGGGLALVYLIYKASKKKVGFANAVGRSRVASETSQTPQLGQQLSPVSNYVTNVGFWSNRIGGTTNPNHGHMIPRGDKIKGYDTWVRADVPDSVSSQNANNPNWTPPLVRGVKVLEHSFAPNGRTSAPYVNIEVEAHKVTKV